MTEPQILGSKKFYEEPKNGMSPTAKIFAFGAIGVGAVALAGIVWIAYQQGIRLGADDDAPVIRAAEEPIKRQPEDPGGLDVPHQDKLVFGRFAPGQIAQPVERLLPPPEEPAERPEVMVEAPDPVTTPDQAPASSTETPAASKPAIEVGEIKTTESEQVLLPSPPEPVVTAPPPPAPSDVASKLIAPPTASKPAKKLAVVPAPAANGGWRVQLAAVSSQDRARSEWNRIKTSNNDLLGTLSLKVQSVNLDRGAFHRIQAGPLGDRSAAVRLCGELKTRGQDCLVVAP